MRLGLPTAETTMSASLVSWLRLTVFQWQRVIVAFRLSRIWKRGRPTRALLPAITTFLPSTFILYSSKIFKTAEGVQGITCMLLCSIIFALFVRVRQSTSLRGSMSQISSLVQGLSMVCSGNCRSIPDIFAFLLRSLINLLISSKQLLGDRMSIYFILTLYCSIIFLNLSWYFSSEVLCCKN